MIHCKYCGDEARHKLDGEVDVCYDCVVRLYRTPADDRQARVFEDLQKIHASVLKMPAVFSYREEWLKHLSERLAWAMVAMGRPAPYQAFAADEEPLPDRTLLLAASQRVRPENAQVALDDLSAQTALAMQATFHANVAKTVKTVKTASKPMKIRSR